MKEEYQEVKKALIIKKVKVKVESDEKEFNQQNIMEMEVVEEAPNK